MLATRVRLRPWRSREIRLVLVGATTIVLASWLTLTPSGRVRSSSPFGPFTLTVRPSRETVTLSGTGTGFFPMRDMVQLRISRRNRALRRRRPLGVHRGHS